MRILQSSNSILVQTIMQFAFAVVLMIYLIDRCIRDLFPTFWMCFIHFRCEHATQHAFIDLFDRTSILDSSLQTLLDNESVWVANYERFQWKHNSIRIIFIGWECMICFVSSRNLTLWRLPSLVFESVLAEFYLSFIYYRSSCVYSQDILSVL